jgi:hypothetical protein
VAPAACRGCSPSGGEMAARESSGMVGTRIIGSVQRYLSQLAFEPCERRLASQPGRRRVVRSATCGRTVQPAGRKS